MDTVRFALGMRMPADRAPGPERCAALLLKCLEGLKPDGLTLWGGEEEGVFTLVLMGGGLGRMRKAHRAILADREFMALLCEDMPFIENNRIAKLKDMKEYALAARRVYG